MFSSIVNPNTARYNWLRGSIIIIEGPIGVGKTTLGNSIVRVLNKINIPSQFYPETIHHQWLELFLTDMRKYALGYELFCTTNRLWIYDNVLTQRNYGTVCVVDRSLDGDDVFAKVLLSRGILSDKEYKVCNSWSHNNTGVEPPDYLIYLKAEPKICMKRTARRNRNGEDNYDMEYFSQLCKEYDIVMSNITPKRNKVVLDWNVDIDTNGASGVDIDTNGTSGTIDNNIIFDILDKLKLEDSSIN